MPGELRKLALVYLFQWYAMVCYWQYLSQSIAKFGAIYKNLLGDDPNNAITFAAILLAFAAVAMLWIKEPPNVRGLGDVLAMPMGGGH